MVVAVVVVVSFVIIVVVVVDIIVVVVVDVIAVLVVVVFVIVVIAFVAVGSDVIIAVFTEGGRVVDVVEGEARTSLDFFGNLFYQVKCFLLACSREKDQIDLLQGLIMTYG